MPVFFCERQWLKDGKEKVSFGIKYTTNRYYEHCPTEFCFDAYADIEEDTYSCAGAQGTPPGEFYMNILKHGSIELNSPDDIDPRTNPRLDHVFGKTIYFTTLFICAVSDDLGTLKNTEEKDLPSDAIRGEYAGMNGEIQAFEHIVMDIATNIGKQQDFDLMQIAKTLHDRFRIEQQSIY